MIPRIVIVGCGVSKLTREAPAAALYTGPYFASCYSAAAVIEPGRVYILSALYGLVRPWRRIRPYDLTLGQQGAVTPLVVQAQAEQLGIYGAPVLALCSARYADLVAEVWHDVERQLAGLGIGEQRGLLARMEREAIERGKINRGAPGRSAGIGRPGATGQLVELSRFHDRMGRAK